MKANMMWTLNRYCYSLLEYIFSIYPKIIQCLNILRLYHMNHREVKKGSPKPTLVRGTQIFKSKKDIQLVPNFSDQLDSLQLTLGAKHRANFYKDFFPRYLSKILWQEASGMNITYAGKYSTKRFFWAAKHDFVPRTTAKISTVWTATLTLDSITFSLILSFFFARRRKEKISDTLQKSES